MCQIMYKWILNINEYHGPVWLAYVWSADDIHLCSIFPYFLIITYTWFGTKYILYLFGFANNFFSNNFKENNPQKKFFFDIFRKNVRLKIIIHLHKGKGPHKTLLKLAESNSIDMTIYTLSIECCFFDISHQLMRKAALSDLL